MAVTLGPNGVSFPGSSNPQTNLEGIVKVGITTSGSRDFSAGSGFGPQWQYSGAEITMGVPQKSSNWYQVRYQTICDDQGGGAQGTGAALYRWTPSSGWGRVADQGHHATLENNVGDFTGCVTTIIYVQYTHLIQMKSIDLESIMLTGLVLLV